MKVRVKKTGEIVNVAGVFLDDGILTIDDVEFVSENNNDNPTVEVTYQLLAQKARDIVYFPIDITEDEKKVLFDIVEEYMRCYEYDYALFDRENSYIEMARIDVEEIIACLYHNDGVGDLDVLPEMSLRIGAILSNLIGHTDIRSGVIYFSFHKHTTSSLN